MLSLICASCWPKTGACRNRFWLSLKWTCSRNVKLEEVRICICLGTLRQGAKMYLPSPGLERVFLHNYIASCLRPQRTLLSSMASSEAFGLKRSLDIAERPRKKYKVADLPITASQRSAIDGLVHTIKKKGIYDVLRKQIWAQYNDSVGSVSPCIAQYADKFVHSAGQACSRSLNQ